MDNELNARFHLNTRKIKISLVYPYYNKRICLERQLQLWAQLPRELAGQLEYVFVDDGSREPPIVPFEYPINLTWLRVKEDIPWNQPGARNLGTKLAEGEWVIASDIDHLLQSEGLSQILSMSKDLRSVYFFSRRREDGPPRNPHPNSFLVSKKKFWEVGGYDEDFCGHYGHNDTFLRLRFERSCRVVLLEHPTLIELNQGATPGLNRSRRHNRWLLKRKRRQLEKGKYRNGRTARFEWEVVGRWRMDTHHPPPAGRTS